MKLRNLNWTFSLCRTGFIIKIAVGIHVDSALPSLCSFPLFEISIKDEGKASGYTRGHSYDNGPITLAFLDVI
jgi:hypothetical protein